MTIRLVTLALLVALLGTFVITPVAAHAAPKSPASPTIPVTGTVSGGTFVGEISNLVFSNRAGNLVLSGVLNGTAMVGNDVIEVVDQAFSAVVTPAVNQACTILTLVVPPIDLNLLGLVVDLDEIHLDITAVPSPDNLLGSLLCAVAGLLDANAPAARLAKLLNQILRLLG